jgi:O-succinylbenzoate synthase
VSEIANPQVQQVLGSARVVSLPLHTKFRGLNQREALLFEGQNGWAEWSPFIEYPDEEAAVWLQAAIEFAFAPQINTLREQIAVNATLPAVAPTEVAGVLQRFGKFNTVKIKVAEPGQSIEEDLARITAAAEFAPLANIRLDANGGYSVQQALQLAHELSEELFEIEYLEQPVATIAEMAELRLKLKTFGLKIAADESVRKVSDPIAVAHAGAADILVLKAAPLGGISRALQISSEAGLPVVVSSALETSVGISMGALLAASLPQLNFDCGLATASLLAADVTEQPLLPIDGKIEVRRVEVSHELLEKHAANQERTEWWLARLERCLKLI